MLSNLNIKNGNNSAIDSLFITNNPNLSCIQANNINYLNVNFTFENNNLDIQHYFDTECNTSTILNTIIHRKNILQKFNILGKLTNNSILQIVIYDDGSVQKKYLIR